MELIIRERGLVRDMGQKGNNFVEYALMLGLVVGIGWGVLGSYGDGIPGIFGSAAELLQAGSKSDKGFMNGPNGNYFD